MPVYDVYEVQEIIEWERFRYRVEADSPEEALKAISGVDPESCGEFGEATFERSGWAVRPGGKPETPGDDPWEEAAAELGKLVDGEAAP